MLEDKDLNSGVDFTLGEGVSLNLYLAEEGIFEEDVVRVKLSLLCLSTITIVMAIYTNSLTLTSTID